MWPSPGAGARRAFLAQNGAGPFAGRRATFLFDMEGARSPLQTRSLNAVSEGSSCLALPYEANFDSDACLCCAVPVLSTLRAHHHAHTASPQPAPSCFLPPSFPRFLLQFTASPHSSGKTFVTQSVAHE